MGQSMQKPTRNTLRNHSSRLSARSLQKSLNFSTAQQKRPSWSASKLPERTDEENIDTPIIIENTQLSNKELLLVSKHEEQAPTIKQSNKLKLNRGSHRPQCSQISPNFREIAQTGVQYGLLTWGTVNTSKQSIEVSHGDAHNDITISFSKAKNMNNNLFYEEQEDLKSNLKQILDYQEMSQQQKSNQPVKHTYIAEKQKYLSNEIDKISATRSIYSQSNIKPSTQADTLHQESTPKKNTNSLRGQQNQTFQNKLTPKVEKKASKDEKITLQAKPQAKISLNNTNIIDQSSYNDYDCADFKRNIKDEQNNGRKVVRMSKKMQQLKQKIASRAVNSKDKETILKGSIQRLSRSLRKNRDDHSLDSRSKDQSKSKTKLILCKVQCLDIKIDSHTQIKLEPKSTKKLQQNLRTNKSPRQSVIEQKNQRAKQQQAYLTKIRSSQQQLGKTKNSSSNTNSGLNKISNEAYKANVVNTCINQNLIIPNNHQIKQAKLSSKRIDQIEDKQPTFTQMMKKQHFGNKQKKKGGDKIYAEALKYSQVQTGKQPPVIKMLFASTCESKNLMTGQQYQFFDIRDPKKPRQTQPKASKQQINSLKTITQQLNGSAKHRKSKIKVTLHEQSNKSSSQELSLRNKTYQQKFSSFDQHSANLTALNYTQIVGNYEEYMLRDALKRQRQGQQWVKEQKKRHRSSQHSSKMTGIKSRSRLLVF